jgi:hypothetical protein
MNHVLFGLSIRATYIPILILQRNVPVLGSGGTRITDAISCLKPGPQEPYMDISLKQPVFSPVVGTALAGPAPLRNKASDAMSAGEEHFGPNLQRRKTCNTAFTEYAVSGPACK